MGASYRALHNVTTNPGGEYIHQDTVDAIVNLATSTVSDRASIVQITATIVRLTTDIATVKEKLIISL